MGELFTKINYYNSRIIPFNFEYYAPQTLQELLELKQKFGDEAKLLAGGTDLIVKMKMRATEPKYIISLNKIKELHYISEDENFVRIGATVTWRELEKSHIIRKYYPALIDSAKVMAGVQVRNMATIGGNLCNASPAADGAPPLIVHSAKVVLQSISSVREVPLEDFFVGPGRTVLKSDEVLTQIVVPKPEERSSSTFIKISRTAMDLAKVSVAAYISLNEKDEVKRVRISLGAVAPTPVLSKSAEIELVGKKPTVEAIKKASLAVLKDISPIDDIRSTAEYRRRASVVLVEDAVVKILSYLGVKYE